MGSSVRTLGKVGLTFHICQKNSIKINIMSKGEPDLELKKGIPPVGSKKAENKPKPKKISGYDYAAWDKFDVDKALESSDEEETDRKAEARRKYEESKKPKVSEVSRTVSTVSGKDEAFTELQGKMQETNQKLRIADVQVESLKKQIVHAQLTDKEIEGLGETTRVYESVGRMFLLTDIPQVRNGLKAKSEKCNEKITGLMSSKEILERSLNESQNNLREMIKHKQQATTS